MSSVSAANQTINPDSPGGILKGVQDTEDNGVLTLNPGIYNKINQDTNIIISKSITIQGNGSTGEIIIDAQGLSRIFTINTRTNNITITFKNITFLNGNEPSTIGGGAIYHDAGTNHNHAVFNIINCSFINNTSPYGAAINGPSSNVAHDPDIWNIFDSTFINNKATVSGVIIVGDILNVYDSNFANNTARDRGAAIYAKDLNVYDSNFTNNSGIWGTIYISRTMYVSGCIFDSNIASLYGSVIYTDQASSNVIINNSNFINNYAGSMAGVILNVGTMTIYGSNFINNSAATAGGAIYNQGVSLSIYDSNFINNSVNIQVSGTTAGGAIYSSKNYFSVTNSTFTGNSARFGGAILNLGDYGSIINSTFISNNAVSGGAIFIVGSNQTIINSTFIRNNATIGGAITNEGDMILLKNKMSDNTAVEGSMIYNLGSIGNLNLTYLNNSTLNVVENQSVSLFAYLTDDMGNTVTGQNISFYVNGILIGSSESIEGYANLTYQVDGSYDDLFPVNGTYEGIGIHSINIREGLLRISKIKTNSTINAPNTEVNKTINITGLAKDENDNPIANTQITVIVDGNSYNVTTDSDGRWNLLFTPTHSGSYEVIVSWNGNSTHEGFNNSSIFNVEEHNENNESNETTDNPTADAAMKKTGIPIYLLLVIAVLSLGLFKRKD